MRAGECSGLITGSFGRASCLLGVTLLQTDSFRILPSTSLFQDYADARSITLREKRSTGRQRIHEYLLSGVGRRPKGTNAGWCRLCPRHMAAGESIPLSHCIFPLFPQNL